MGPPLLTTPATIHATAQMPISPAEMENAVTITFETSLLVLCLLTDFTFWRVFVSVMLFLIILKKYLLATMWP